MDAQRLFCGSLTCIGKKMKNQFLNCYEGKTVLVTGHTGFKGSWLALWLKELGAQVIGYSLPPPTTPSHFAATRLEEKIIHIEGDIRDFEKLQQAITHYQPEIIFHLAAQAIVLDSYADPKATFEINAQGTVNVLEAARHCEAVQAMVMITTDKCYDNKEWIWGYRENDPLGGQDPYSASKAMAELAIAAYQKSFFKENGPAVASARAGNVIGGGDFSPHRTLPDSMKALIEGKPIQIRNPHSIRPWTSVLDPLSGYLWLGVCLLEEGRPYAQAWNFGPLENPGIAVHTLVEKAIELWGEGEWVNASKSNIKPEMKMLRLAWDKAANDLNWRPVYNWEESVKETIDWFKAYAAGHDMYEVAVSHIEDHAVKASELNLPWAKEREKVCVRN